MRVVYKSQVVQIAALLICIVSELFSWGNGVAAFEDFRKSLSNGADRLNLKNEKSSICDLTSPFVSRPHSVTITEFGAVGDGETSNTLAFQNAIFYLRSFADKGGAQLYVPKGRWLTGSFNLTSHLTLFLEEGAEILASQDPNEWPVIDPLPSYGRGRELPGGRHISLIHGENLMDVVITGGNGTIDGQGSIWWERYRNKTLNHTRGHLVEFINSEYITISNITFKNSPFWTIHPVYCSNVVIRDVTILAPQTSPNTDGIDPDSSSDVCIEDCYISVGDDLISIKSGWDEYGIAYNRSSSNILIRRVTGQSQTSSGIAFGSEMSGGISNVQVEGLMLMNTRRGIRIKSAAGRGGYLRNIAITDVVMQNISVAFEFTDLYGDHPDDRYDPEAYPVIERISIKNVAGTQIAWAGSFTGIKESPFRDICFSNISLISDNGWNCSFVKGFSSNVSPQPCPELETVPDDSVCCFSSSGSTRQRTAEI